MSENFYNPGEGNSAAQEPKKSKKGLIITIAAVAAVAVIASVVAGIFLSAPLTLVARGAANSAKALQKTEMMTLFTEMATGGSMELALGLEELTEQAFGYALDGSVNLKFYGSKDLHRAATMDVVLDGTNFVDLSIFGSGEELILTSDALLDGDAYGIDFETAADNFEDSIFGPNGELSIGIDDIEMFVDLLKSNQEMTAKMEELCAETMKVLLASLKEHAEVSKESDTLKFAGKSTKVTAVEIVLDDDAIADVIGDVLDYLRDSDTFEEYLEMYAEYAETAQKLSAFMEYMEGQYYYQYYYDIYSFDDFYQCFYGDYETDVDDVYDSLDDLEDNLKYMEIDELALVCYITKSGTQLVGTDLKIKVDGDVAKFSLMAGPSLDELTELRFVMDQGYNSAELQYKVKTNDKSEYAATLTVEGDGYEILSAKIEWDKKKGDFAIALDNDGGDKFELTGEFKMDKKSAEISLETISSYGDEVELDLTIVVNASDKMPSVPSDYEDILALSYSDAETLGADIAAGMMQKYYSLDEETIEILEYLLYNIM